MDLLDAIPIDLHRAPLLEIPIPQKRALRNPKTILLAEDDNDLRWVMERTLIAMGYQVIACPDAELAFSAFRAASSVDILLTDFQMPGKSGVELARELTEARPSLPVMIITGSSLSTEILKEIHDNRWIYVSKPCRMPLLEASLEQILLPGPATTTLNV